MEVFLSEYLQPRNIFLVQIDFRFADVRISAGRIQETHGCGVQYILRSPQSQIIQAANSSGYRELLIPLNYHVDHPISIKPQSVDMQAEHRKTTNKKKTMYPHHDRRMIHVLVSNFWVTSAGLLALQPTAGHYREIRTIRAKTKPL